MSKMSLDNIDRKLLNLLQAEFPLTEEPYTDVGLRVGIDGDEVVHRIEQLKSMGIVRQIGPVLDARSLGYQTTLVAMRVVGSQLDKAAQLIVDHPGVSHGYERDHHFNFWFTLAIPPTSDVETDLRQLTSAINTEDVFSLPAKKLFKIRAFFAVGGNGESMAEVGTQLSGIRPQKVELSRVDRLIINELQQELPLIPRPFAAMSKRSGIEVEDFLAQCQSLEQRGIMRRFGAAINHKRVGFKANAMVCWVAPPDVVDVVGCRLASLREVSHCYERETNPLWHYNLFAMVHGYSSEVCQQIADKVSDEAGLTDYILLFSTKEFKKVRVKYPV